MAKYRISRVLALIPTALFAETTGFFAAAVRRSLSEALREFVRDFIARQLPELGLSPSDPEAKKIIAAVARAMRYSLSQGADFDRNVLRTELKIIIRDYARGKGLTEQNVALLIQPGFCAVLAVGLAGGLLDAAALEPAIQGFYEAEEGATPADAAGTVARLGPATAHILQYFREQLMTLQGCLEHATPEMVMTAAERTYREHGDL